MPASSPPNDVRVVVDGTEFSNWQRYAIESDLLQPSDAFSFTAPNLKGSDGKYLATVIKKGARVTITLDGVPQMVGYVDEQKVTRNKDDGEVVEFTGRDDFQFLVDCSATPESLKAMDLKKIAERLGGTWIKTWQVEANSNRAKLMGAKRRAAFLKSHATEVDKLGGASKALTEVLEGKVAAAAANLAKIKAAVFPRVKVEPGETPFDVIQRLAHRAGMLVWCAANGDGIIARPSYGDAAFYKLLAYARDDARRQANNVITIERTSSWRDQYSTITVLGSSGNTKAISAASARHKQSATEASIKAGLRPLIIQNGDVRNLKDAKDQAQREVDRRAFEADLINVKVRGHYNQGWPWQIDFLCDVQWPSAGVEAVYYVTKRRFYGSKDGRFTDVQLQPKGKLLA